jgi:hypothetical protein
VEKVEEKEMRKKILEEMERKTKTGFKLGEILEAKLKEKEREKIEIPKNPGEHIEMMKELENEMEEAQKARQESIEKLEEAIEKGEEVEKSESLYLRLKELHKRYEKEKEEETKKAFEAFEKISHLDNEMFEAEEFLRELKETGKYDPQNPQVKEAEFVIARNKIEIEKIKKENPLVEKIFLAPMEEWLKEMEEKERERKKFENLCEKLKILSETSEPLYWGDLRQAIEQAKDYLGVKDLVKWVEKDGEKIKVIDTELEEKAKKEYWKFLKVGDKVYFKKKESEESKEIFKLLKKIEEKVKEADKKRKMEMNELKKESTHPIKELFNNSPLPGAKVFVEINFPVELPKEKRIFVRGGILFECCEGKRACFWKVAKIVGNVGEKLRIKKGYTFCAGFVNAPLGLKNALKRASEIEEFKEKEKIEKEEKSKEKE